MTTERIRTHAGSGPMTGAKGSSYLSRGILLLLLLLRHRTVPANWSDYAASSRSIHT